MTITTQSALNLVPYRFRTYVNSSFLPSFLPLSPFIIKKKKKEKKISSRFRVDIDETIERERKKDREWTRRSFGWKKMISLAILHRERYGFTLWSLMGGTDGPRGYEKKKKGRERERKKKDLIHVLKSSSVPEQRILSDAESWLISRYSPRVGRV